MSAPWGRLGACVVLFCSVIALGGHSVSGHEATDRKILKKVEPEYPALLRDKGIVGTVRVRVTVRPDGTVKDAQPIGGNAILLESALRAVKQWRYSASDRESAIEVAIHFGPHN